MGMVQQTTIEGLLYLSPVHCPFLIGDFGCVMMTRVAIFMGACAGVEPPNLQTEYERTQTGKNVRLDRLQLKKDKGRPTTTTTTTPLKMHRILAQETISICLRLQQDRDFTLATSGRERGERKLIYR